MVVLDTTHSVIRALGFLALFLVTVFTVSALVCLRLKAFRSDRSRRAMFHRRQEPRRGESAAIEDSMYLVVSPSHPTIVGHWSKQNLPIIHMTITPPTPAKALFPTNNTIRSNQDRLADDIDDSRLHR
ncbi:hypothetical protein BJ138DRAFT_761490 [Hygrophoropsis aurantiaca]|uniref:Uncharacterized protein n=1 Tax=Hygrophoropsis aurantiaca TaxID=72124 RepID=A0ACB8ARZ1_9AGAM|nr:hypothetical protein BJ138DRAFT_761490 [Hygrophoropsis aurantiaca]